MTHDEPRHLHSLDIARGIAAFAVVFWHWQHFFVVGLQPRADFRAQLQPMFSVFRLFYMHGHEAVSLFFSLSGFIFFWLFARNISDGTLSLSRFFLHRFSRLYPLHLATLLLVAVAQPIYRLQHGANFVYAWNDLPHFLLNLLLLSTIGRDTGLSFNGPSWSVSVEMTLYAIFFLSCAILKPRLIAMLVIALSGYLLLGHYKTTLGTAVGSFFIGGCMSALYTILTRDAARMRIAKAIVAGVPVLCLTAYLVPAGPAGLLPRVVLPGDEPDLLTVVIFPLCILALALAEFLRPEVFARVARLTRLGQLSYSVYLIHFPLQLFLMIAIARLGIDARIFYTPLALFVFFATLIVLGLVSHYQFEMPVQRWLRTKYNRNSAP